MNKVKLIFVIIAMMLLSIVFSGCPGRAKKPATPTPKPGKVTLDTINPAKAPAMVKDLIEKQKDKESFNVIRSGDTFYAVVTRGKVPFKDLGIKFKDIEKLDIGNGKNQVRIQVLFTVPDIFPGKNNDNTRRARALTPKEKAAIKEKLGQRGEFFPVAVAKITINTLPDAFTYTIMRDREIPAEITENTKETTPPVTQQPQTQPPQTSITPSQPTGAGISVVTPPANALVTTPLTVSGKAKATTVTIELKDDRGNVLATKTVGVNGATTGQAGDYNTILTFTPLTQQVKGTLDVFIRGTNGTKEGLVTVPLTIK